MEIHLSTDEKRGKKQEDNEKQQKIIVQRRKRVKKEAQIFRIYLDREMRHSRFLHFTKNYIDSVLKETAGKKCERCKNIAIITVNASYSRDANILISRVNENVLTMVDKESTIAEGTNTQFTMLHGPIRTFLNFFRTRHATKIQQLHAEAELANFALDEIDESDHQLETNEFKNIELAISRWNERDCSRNLAISKNGTVLTYSGQYEGLNTVRAILPVPCFNRAAKSTYIAFYFEMEILKITYSNGISIGFCTKQFPLEEGLGDVHNSTGIWRKGRIIVNGKRIFFNNAGGNFASGDMIGIGLIYVPKYSTTKCFATCNATLLGLVELSSNYADLQLFPGATLYAIGDSIRAKFDKREWHFSPRKLYQALNENIK